MKSMSMLEVDAKRSREEDEDLVEKDCVEEVVRKMVMCHCGCGGSLAIDRVASGMTLALLPC